VNFARLLLRERCQVAPEKERNRNEEGVCRSKKEPPLVEGKDGRRRDSGARIKEGPGTRGGKGDEEKRTQERVTDGQKKVAGEYSAKDTEGARSQSGERRNKTPKRKRKPLDGGNKGGKMISCSSKGWGGEKLGKGEASKKFAQYTRSALN